MPVLLDHDHGDLRDPDKIIARNQIAAEYAGISLCSRTRCFWKVRERAVLL